MKRLLPFAALLVLAALVFWILQGGGASPEDQPLQTDRPEVEQLAAGSLDAGPERILEEVEEPFDPRAEKIGTGNFGLVGTVVDEKGVPLPDMWIGAYSSPYPLFDFEVNLEEILERPLELSLEPLAAVRSDAEGHFQLEGLAGRGTYLVARGHHHLTRGRQEVRPTDLDSEEGVILHTVPGASLEGTVVDELGAPVANAEVFVGPSLMYIIQAIRSRDIYLERVFTDGAGRFAIDAVPANMKLSVVGLDGATHPGMRDFGPLNPATDAKIKLQLVETGKLQGRIVDSEGEGVRGAKVLAIPIDLRMLVGVVRALPEYIVESGSDGRFEFPELPKRNMVLIAQGREGRAAPVTCAVTGPDSEVGKDLVLQTILDVEGRVVDLNGNPIANAKVMLNSIPSAGDRDFRSGGMPSADFLLMEAAGEILPEFLPVETWARTDAKGAFHLPAWEGAKIKIEAEGFSKAIFELPKETEEERLALIMMQPGSVAGTVTEQANDKPLQFYVVNAEQTSNMLEPKVEVEMGEDEDRRSFRDRKRQLEAVARKQVMADILADGEIAVLPQESMMSNLRNVQFQEDGSGIFRIDDLMPGTYKVEARADGFVVRSHRDVVVKPGEVTEDIDLKMSRGAVLKGRVVAFGSREAVAGAVVTIGKSKESGFEAYFRMGLETTAMARSGADGSFTLEGIEEGMEWVHVMAEGFSPTSIRGRPLELEEVREDVVIQVRQGCNINGHVYDRNGVPIPARLVGGFSMDSQDFWQAATNEDGYYHVEHVKPGSYFVITASLDNEALFTGNFMSVLNGSRIVQAYAKEGQTITVDIEDLSAGGCNLKGSLLSNGLPLTNATMFAMATETGGMFDMRMATSLTDDEGKFEFESLAPGNYSVQIDSPDWRGAIELDVPEAEEDYQVLETPQGIVRGRVLTEHTGSPVDGATVKLVRDDSSGGLFAMFTGGKQTDWGQSDEDGNFEFEGKPAGRYYIEVEINGWRDRDKITEGAPLGKAKTKPFTLYENDTKLVDDIRLPISSAIRVIITDAQGNAPQEGYTLSAIRDGAEEGEDPVSNWGFGKEGLISGVEAGTYTVRVEGRGFAKAQLEGVVVGEAETVEVDLRVEEGILLNARILGPNSQPIPGAAIRVYDADGKRVDGLDGPTAAFSRMFSSGDGTMPLGTYVPGRYTVEVDYEGVTQTRTTILSAGETTVVEFQF